MVDFYEIEAMNGYGNIHSLRDSTREGRRPGSVTPDETRDGIAGAEPQKIGSAIGKGKALMRSPSFDTKCQKS